MLLLLSSTTETIIMEITQADIEAIFKSFESKDIEQILPHFAEDAVLIDPHYPVTEMKGKEAIRKGLTWGLKPLVSASFKVDNFWVSGNEGAIKMDTNHVFKGGKKISIMQVFLFSMNEKKELVYLQSFVPYRPDGIDGIALKIIKMFWN
jgi:ketosteroid isomerase-like protein